MENKDENLNSEIEELNIEISDDDDVDALKDKFTQLSDSYKKVSETHKKTLDTNKQLYSRAKKAEGFELKDGKWVKPEKSEKVEPKPKKSSEPTKDEDYSLSLDQETYLNTKIQLDGESEIEFTQNWMKRTGESDVRALVKDDVYLAKLESLRKETMAKNATPKGNSRSAPPVNDEFSVAMAEYEETGKLPKDRALREKVVETKAKRESSENMFYNS